MVRTIMKREYFLCQMLGTGCCQHPFPDPKLKGRMVWRAHHTGWLVENWEWAFVPLVEIGVHSDFPGYTRRYPEWGATASYVRNIRWINRGELDQGHIYNAFLEFQSQGFWLGNSSETELLRGSPSIKRGAENTKGTGHRTMGEHADFGCSPEHSVVLMTLGNLLIFSELQFLHL